MEWTECCFYTLRKRGGNSDRAEVIAYKVFIKRLPYISLLVMLLLLVPTLVRAELVRVGHVQVELIADATTVQPGGTVNVALRILHDPNWHSYWESSTTGYPPRVEWKLPQGWKAGTLAHPLPEIHAAGGIVDYVHTGDALFVTKITVPKDAKAGTRSRRLVARLQRGMRPWRCEAATRPARGRSRSEADGMEREDCRGWRISHRDRSAVGLARATLLLEAFPCSGIDGKSAPGQSAPRSRNPLLFQLRRHR
jgi:hypothetical protein